MMACTPEQLKQKTDDEINEIAAVVCMGWEAKDTDYVGRYHNSEGKYICAYDDWQPCSPTEAGKAQCWMLSEKYALTVDYKNSYAHWHEFSDCDNPPTGYGEDVETQRAVCEAAILSAQGEMK